MSKMSLLRSLASLALTSTLSIGLACAPSRAIGLSASDSGMVLPAASRSDSEIDRKVRSLISSGDYVEGEAIVCRLGSAAGTAEMTGQSDDAAGGLLAHSETLSSVTAQQYVEATGESIPVQVGQGLTPQSAEEQVEILKVCDYSLSTEQLLRELLRDPQVLSAEPNYLMRLEEDEAQALEDEEQESPQASEWDATSVDAQDLAVPVEEPLASAVQSDAYAASASQDLTELQWFSVGVDAAVPQYPNASNPGVRAPHWNEPGTSNASGVVAILDSGVDYTHPDLAGVMYHFSPEQQEELGCGEFGYAPAREDTTDPMDGYNHGTHCAGIMAAEWNDFGVSGIANGVQLVAVSVSRSLTSADYSYDSIIKGYDFLIRAAKAGVDIRSVNRSISMEPANNADEVMVRAAGEVGIVTCQASGNEHMDLDANYTDASLIQPNPYIVRVNASNPQDYRAPFSNYGTYTTDLFAPGVSILSTIPSNQEDMSCYFPSADPDPIFVMTDFGSALPDVLSTDCVQVDEVTRGDIGVDGDGSCVKAHITTEAGSYASVYVDVPAGDLSKDNVQDIYLALNIGENKARYAGVAVLLEDGTTTDEYFNAIVEDGTNAGPNGWVYVRLRIKDPDQIPSDFARVTDSQGNSCIRLIVGFRPYTTSYEPDIAMDVDMYIDQIAFGRRGNEGCLPYCYMTGTSMATPCVTGCAAIVSSTLDTADPATRAATTVRMLKGAVRQAAGYHGLCKQNGALDLSLLGNTDAYVPEIENAQVSGNTLVVSGAYFASEGTLLVGDAEAQVLSWSDGTIEAVWPQGVSSGLIPVAVRTSGGAESCRAFILEAPRVTSEDVSLYERDLTPVNVRADGKSATSIPSGLAATQDGTLFAVTTDSDDRPYAGTRYLMRSDDQGQSWTNIELSVELKNARIVAGDGKIYVLGGTPASKSFGRDFWELFEFDTSQGTFRQLAKYDASSEDENIIRVDGSLACANGYLFFVESYLDFDDYNSDLHMRIRRFDADKGTFEDAVLLEHDYQRLSFISAPKVAVAGNRIYVCNMTASGHSDDVSEPVEKIVGLELVEVASDGSLSCTDLSTALYGLTEGVGEDDFCIAASEEGLFLIGAGLDALLPAGAQRTDTFLLRSGASSFEPYDKTLSFGPFTSPVSACTDGWLYAFGISKYEVTPLFGRATKVTEEEPEPVKPDEPEPRPEPGQPSQDNVPSASGTAKKSSAATSTTSSRTALAKTGDDLVERVAIIVLLASAGAASVAFGLKRTLRTVGWGTRP